MENTKKTVGIYTLGCRLNIYESDGILNQFRKHGYQIVKWEEAPDVAIINTCTVTHQADAKNRNIIRGILKKNPDAKVLVTGCYAQTDKEKLEQMEGISAIIGNERKSQIYTIFQNLSQNHTMVVSEGPLQYFENSKKRKVVEEPFHYGDVIPVDHTRAYLKIQDGCDRKCSYCKIPMARGGGISRPIEEILDQVEMLQDKKIPEIVLTGVNLGWYRFRRYRFWNLVEKILDRLQYTRLRISSIEPSDVNERLAELSLHPRFCNFFHIPVQSGSDKILRLMKRSYRVRTLAYRIEKLKKINPDVFLGTDVIVGFPSETEEDFLQTLQVIDSLGFIHIHAFPFSLRSGTSIESYLKKNPDVLISKETIKKRMRSLMDFKNRKLLEWVQKRIGNIYEGIVEKKEKNFLEVLTDNYLKVTVHFPSNISLLPSSGDFIQVQLTKVVFDHLSSNSCCRIYGRLLN